MRRALVALFGFVSFLMMGCAVHHHHGRPFAYGVHSSDWLIEAQSQSCAASCQPQKGDVHLLCLSECPGFVTADVDTCRDVPEWDVCRVGYESAVDSRARTEEGRNRRGEKVALGTLRLLGTVATSLLEASLDDDDNDDADHDHAHDKRRKRRTEEDSPARRKKKKKRRRRVGS